MRYASVPVASGKSPAVISVDAVKWYLFGRVRR
jgi:hypothetical protein